MSRGYSESTGHEFYNHETPSAASGRNQFNLHEKEGLTQSRKEFSLGAQLWTQVAVSNRRFPPLPGVLCAFLCVFASLRLCVRLFCLSERGCSLSKFTICAARKEVSG
jgi:hypothetical protein